MYNFGSRDHTHKEVVTMAENAKQKRHQWCEKQAREYLSSKFRRKYYRTLISSPEVDMWQYVQLCDEHIEAINKAIKNLYIEGSFDSKEQEAIAISDAIADLNLNGKEYIDIPYEYADILDVDLNDYIYCYSLEVITFNPNDNGPQTCEAIVQLTDEQYIQVITEMLYAPHELSLDGLEMCLPEIGHLIRKKTMNTFYPITVFLKEFNDDVNAILAKYGGRENTPYIGVFENIFVQIAESQCKYEQRVKDKN